MEWYYARNNQQVGPVSETEFAKLVQDGTITRATFVWHGGMSDWMPYEKVLAGDPTPAPTPATATPEPTDLKRCAECGVELPADRLIPFEGSFICATCKPAFFQKIQEGAPTASRGGTGATHNRDLTAKARAALQGRWGAAIGFSVLWVVISVAVFIVASIAGAVIPLSGQLVSVFLTPPLLLSFTHYFIAVARGEPAGIDMIGLGFRRYWVSVGTVLLQQLIATGVILIAAIPAIALFIWALVSQSPDSTPLMILAFILYIPAVMLSVVVSFMFAMAMYIIADDPDAGVIDALKRSRQMMAGVKWKFFRLNFRFFGWGLLSILTCYVGMLWLIPYLAASHAFFYDDVRGRAPRQ